MCGNLDGSLSGSLHTQPIDLLRRLAPGPTAHEVVAPRLHPWVARHFDAIREAQDREPVNHEGGSADEVRPRERLQEGLTAAHMVKSTSGEVVHVRGARIYDAVRPVAVRRHEACATPRP